MNGQQQREHRSRMQQIEAETARAVMAAAERLDRLECAIETQKYEHNNLVRAVSDVRVDHAATRELGNSTSNVLFAFVNRGFWARLNWLITGR